MMRMLNAVSVSENDKMMEDFKELVIIWGLESLFTVGVKFKNGLYLGVSLYGHEDFPDCYAVGLNEANDEIRWFFKGRENLGEQTARGIGWLGYSIIESCIVEGVCADELGEYLEYVLSQLKGEKLSKYLSEQEISHVEERYKSVLEKLIFDLTN